MGAMASEITSLTVVDSAIYSGADQRRHQSSASLAFVRGIHRGPVNSPHKWPITRKCFHLMTSSWIQADGCRGLKTADFLSRDVFAWDPLHFEVISGHSVLSFVLLVNCYLEKKLTYNITPNQTKTAALYECHLHKNWTSITPQDENRL